MINLLVLGIVIAIIGMAVFYIIKAKKRGDRCIGCSLCTSKKATCTCHHK